MHGENTPHCMRVMLVAHLDDEHGFATGTAGRLAHWYPDVAAAGEKVKSVRANSPEVQARFYHEASYQCKTRYLLPHVDFLDIEPRKEVVGTSRGKPSMSQLTVQPAYCLTIHKVQALTIRHVVDGCLEGMFALGQMYVLWSRVTDPALFHAVGLPPNRSSGRCSKSMGRGGLGCQCLFHRRC